jgi:hypothetical protein
MLELVVNDGDGLVGAGRRHDGACFADEIGGRHGRFSVRFGMRLSAGWPAASQ